MKKFIKILKRIGIVLLSLIVFIGVGTFVYLNYKTVLARHKIPETEKYAVSVSEFAIPDGTTIVGLGEASHGNVEFQELKLEVFKNLVENYGYKAFGLELDFGEGLLLNDYIQGGESTAEEILLQSSFMIYHTKQMAALIDWMREYNQTAPEDGKLRFYGFDMQNGSPGALRLTDYCRKHGDLGIDSELLEIEALTDTEVWVEDEEIPAVKKALETVRLALEKKHPNDTEYPSILHACDALIQQMGSYDVKAEDYSNYRDQCMAENVGWILEQESLHGNDKLMIAAHNGHISRSWMDGCSTFGGRLSDTYGDAYYAVGTDFFTADININTSSMDSEEYVRSNHHFCSADPLAYQAKYMDDGMYYLDFSTVPEESKKLYGQIYKETPMGNIGEGYSWVWYLFPNRVYRPSQVPAEMYDAMIFVYDNTPIEIFGE